MDTTMTNEGNFFCQNYGQQIPEWNWMKISNMNKIPYQYCYSYGIQWDKKSADLLCQNCEKKLWVIVQDIQR